MKKIFLEKKNLVYISTCNKKNRLFIRMNFHLTSNPFIYSKFLLKYEKQIETILPSKCAYHQPFFFCSPFVSRFRSFGRRNGIRKYRCSLGLPLLVFFGLAAVVAACPPFLSGTSVDATDGAREREKKDMKIFYDINH